MNQRWTMDIDWAALNMPKVAEGEGFEGRYATFASSCVLWHPRASALVHGFESLLSHR